MFRVCLTISSGMERASLLERGSIFLMKRFFSIGGYSFGGALFAAALSWLDFAPSAGAEDRWAGEFVSLFNGRDFQGWRLGESGALPREMPAAWRVADGVIRGTGPMGQMLATQWDYADMEFEFEWRATEEGYDADFYVHGDRLLDADPLRIKKGLEGGPQETDRGEGQYHAKFIGGGGNARKAVPDLQKPVGEWNVWRVRTAGKMISLTCNGKEAWTSNDFVPRRGYLGFRVIKGPLELRNLRVREDGFQSLADFGGWEVYPGFGGNGPMAEHWTREGLMWTFKGKGPSIVTKRKDYRNYNARIEFRFVDPDPTDINTGIYLRGQHPWQADIWHHKWGSGLWGMLHAYVPAKKNIQDLGKALRPSVKMDNPPGEWNFLDVRLENNVVSTWLNGRTTVDRYPIKEADPKFPDVGGIGLQAHFPWKEVQFHNFRVKVLD